MHSDLKERVSFGRRKGKCKGPEARAWLACSRTEETRVARVV